MSNYQANCSPEPDWSDEEWDDFRSWIKQLLQTTPEVRITFTKTDGSERVMRCTLDPSMLPAQEIKETKEPRRVNTSVLPVFDIDLNAWRSFKIRSVKEIEFSIVNKRLEET